MRLKMLTAAVLAAAPVAGLGAGAEPRSNEALKAEVIAAEKAFAKTMADRDHAAFAAMVSDEAVFWGSKGLSRGRPEVAAVWKPLFEGAKAPFSWEPQDVEVLASGNLSFSSGPVHDAEGKRVGTYNSVWRLEADGQWRIVFDKGCPPCPACPQ